jgi:hypothetical protein
MTTSLRVLLASAVHGAVRGLAVVALVLVWSVAHVGTYLGIAGLSSLALTASTGTAEAGWGGWGWRRRRWRRWRRW